jgi:hypothetical protein
VAKKGTYYLGRVIKLGTLDQALLMQAMLNPSPYKSRGNAWTIIDCKQYRSGQQDFIFGRLSKYVPEGEVTVIDEEKRQERQQREPNLQVASSPFIYVPSHSGIAFLNVYGHIEQKTFMAIFAGIIEETYRGFFVECHIELVSDLKSFAAKLNALEKIFQIRAKVFPPNPLFGPLWEPLKEYLISRNTGTMSITEDAPDCQSIDTDIQDIVQQAADQTEENAYFTNERIPIGDAAILMAADGYGIGAVRGIYEDEVVVVKTSETAKNFSFDKNPVPHELYEKVFSIFIEIEKNRHMQH